MCRSSCIGSKWLDRVTLGSSTNYDLVNADVVQGQNAGGQNACQNCKNGQNAGQLWGRVDKILVISSY